MHRLLKVSEVSSLLGLHLLTVYQMIRRGDIESVRVGSRGVRISEKTLEEWLKERSKRNVAKA